MTFQHLQDKAFCRLVKQVLNAEGGWSNHKADPGGPTYRGIAYNYNVVILKRFGIMNGSQAEMYKITPEIACEIYYLKYWLPCNAHQLHDLRLQYAHFDACVNQGVGAANQFMADLVKEFGKDPRWIMGNGKNEGTMMAMVMWYLFRRLKAYNSYRNRGPFLEGWLNRILHLADHIRQFGKEYQQESHTKIAVMKGDTDVQVA